jgi:putative ABC transport system permease protein
MWGWTWLEEALRDARVSLRALRRTPAFAAIIVATLALGIGANTAIFTLVNAVLIEPLPYPDPDRLAVVWEETARRPGRANVISPANFLRWRERSSAFEQLAALYDHRASLSGVGEPEELVVRR